jgi:hypothetical protein
VEKNFASLRIPQEGRPRSGEDGPVKYAAHFTGERGRMAEDGGRKSGRTKVECGGCARCGRSGVVRGRRGFTRRRGGAEGCAAQRTDGGERTRSRCFSRRHGEHGGFLGLSFRFAWETFGWCLIFRDTRFLRWRKGAFRWNRWSGWRAVLTCERWTRAIRNWSGFTSACRSSETGFCGW